MASRTDAQKHIERLRSELDPARHPRFASLMTNALDLIVSQLYDRSTHFIHEFLQNLDDTAYEDSVVPTVKFIYTPGRLRVNSNQIGFSAKDIDAICAIGSSTKADEKHSAQFIGEKGIGFKSVFRIANKVWLSSRNYSIRWDREAQLGAMTPEWASFPESLEEGETIFLAELIRDEQQEQIVDDLENFDASLILFLTKIRRVYIEVHGDDGKRWTKLVTRRDIEEIDYRISVLQDGQEQLSYLKSDFTAASLPREPRRHRASTSELVLAFPLQQDSSNTPPTNTAYVCSGLPIGNYGLKFYLNADFILTASRQTIDVSLPWNMALRDALPLALVQAVEHLTKTSCRYTWPWFVTAGAPSDFFEPALKAARNALASTRCLEACDGRLRLPTYLTYVDQRSFSGDDGRPMTLSNSTEAHYLSLRYPTWMTSSIINLGVSRLTNGEFLRDLDRMIVDEPVVFQGRPSQWHENLATVLLPQVDVPELKEKIRQLSIVPILDGSWSNTTLHKGKRVQRVPRPVFWPTDIDLHGSEANLPFSVVEFESAAGVNRRKLFERLGIETLDPQRICRGIITAHATNGPGSFMDEAAISSGALISHAILLCRESWAPKFYSNSELWFVSRDGQRRRGSDLYTTRGPQEFPQASGVPAILRGMSPKLHPDYLESDTLSHASSEHHSDSGVSSSQRREDFVDYLVRTFRVSTVPRLVKSNALNACEFSLSVDFRNLFEKYHASHIFQLILDKWELYSHWIDLDELHKHCDECLSSRASLLREIRELPSRIEHGSNTQVLDTVLPNIDPLIQDRCGDLAILQVSKYEDEAAKSKLHCLGVTTRRCSEFYLKCLKAITGQKNPSEEHVAYLYQQMQAYYEDDKEEIEHTFLKDNLIFLSGRLSTQEQAFRGWTNISHCIKMGIRLEDVYPSSAQLFRTLQAADGLGLHELIGRIISLSANLTNSLIPSLIHTLCQLSKAIAAMSRLGATRKLKSLKSKPIFPVITGDVSLATEFRSSRDEGWYIADRSHLRQSFIGKVTLLNVPTAEMHQMDDLFSCLGLWTRKMSLCVTTRTDPKGSVRLRASDTKLLQSRAPFFEALTPPSDTKKPTVLSHIAEATVSSAAEIIDSHQLIGRVILRGRDTRSQAVWQIEGGHLRLFVSAKSSSTVPLIHLAEHLLDFCGIQNPLHVLLLHMLLTEPSDEEIESAFVKAGVHVRVPGNSRVLETDHRLAENAFWRYASSAMDLPGPFDFEDSNAENFVPFSFSNDLLQRFHSNQGPHMKGDREKPEKDRRLNLMRHHCEHAMGDEEVNSTRTPGKRLDPNSDLKYLGEELVSLLFRRELGKHYDPMLHWTSPLRTRAGLPEFPNETTHASFTMSGPTIAQRVTELLAKRGWKGLAQCRATPPAYHFDVGVSVGGFDDTFEWTTSQLQMAQEYRYLNSCAEGLPAQKNVLVLIRITNVYTEPNFSLILDPWSHFNYGALRLQPDCILKASLQLMSPQTRQGNFSQFTDSNRHSDAEATVGPTSEFSCRVSASQCSPDNEKIQSRDLSDPPAEQHTEHESPLKSRPRQLPVTGNPPKERSSASFDRKRKRSLKPSPDNSDMHPPAKKLASAVITPYSYKYKYTGLRENEIRLFTLFPGEDTERLQGILWTTTSKTAGAYTTLSYVWGPNYQSMYTLRTTSGNLLIRGTLHTALVSLRQRREPLTLWVDALCINQEDKREKSRQITLLAEIFQRSISTLAFIGGAEDHSEAIQMLMQVRARMLLGPSSDEWPEDLPRCPPLWEERGMPFPEDDIWVKVAAFFENAWFRRAWIVQEAVIARRLKIVHGKTTIDWNHLFLVMNHINEELEATGRGESNSWVPFLKLGRLRHIEDRSGRVSILKLLENFRHAKSSDPRDKFFSLLGIASDGNLEEFEPEYSSSLTEITQRFAIALFRRFSNERQAMLLLYRAGLSQSETLPSWVPDWLEEKPNGLHDALARGNDFNACADLAEQIRYVPDTGELEVEAYLVDEVEYVTESCNGLGKQEQRRYFAQVKYLLEGVFGDVWDDEQIQRVLWEAPIAGAKHPKIALPGDLSIHDSWKAFVRLLGMEWLGDDDGAQSPQDESDLEAKSRVYQSLLADEVRNWRFVILKERNLCGIAPNIVQEGDVVHLFHGGVVPFITRRSEERDGAYRLIGQCYIWGMMQGEGTGYDELIQDTVRLH